MVFIARSNKENAFTAVIAVTAAQFIPQVPAKVNGNLRFGVYRFAFLRAKPLFTAGEQFFPEIFVQQRFLQKIVSSGGGGAFGLQRQADGEGRAAPGWLLASILPP
jgi:hypothetical protein